MRYNTLGLLKTFQFFISISLIFGLHLFQGHSLANEKPKIITGQVLAQEGETLLELLSKRLQISDEVLYEKGRLKDIIRWNPEIRGKDDILREGQRVYIEVPYSEQVIAQPFHEEKEKKVLKKKKEPDQSSDKELPPPKLKYDVDLDSYELNPPKLITGHVLAKEGENLEELLSQRLQVPDKILFEQGQLDKIKRWNPKISDFNNLQKEDLIYIEVPYTAAINKKILVSKKTAKKAKKSQKPFFPTMDDLRDIELFNLHAEINLSLWNFKEVIRSSTINTERTYDAFMLSLTGKASSHFGDSDWGAGAEVKFDLIPLSTSGSEATARRSDMKLYLHREVRDITEKQDIHFLGGGRISRMIVENNAFGYDVLVAPYIGGEYRRHLEGGSSWFFSSEWVFLVQGAEPGTGEREVSLSAGYSFALKNGQKLDFSAQFSSLRYHPSAQAEISSNTYSLAFTYKL